MDFDSRSEHRSSLLATLRERTGPADVVALVSVPLVLCLLFAAPMGVRRALVFEYRNPSLIDAFASTYVHFDAVHLLVNVASYVLVATLAYVLSVASGHRRRFYSVFVTFLFVFPFALSYMNLAIGRSAVAYGFSGVTMAFVGYLPFSLATYLEERFDIGPGAAIAPAAFFLSFALIAALSMQSVMPDSATVLLGTSGLVAAAVLSACLYAIVAYDRGGGFRTKLRTAASETGYFELLVVAVVVIGVFPVVAFPADPTVGTGTLNLYAHLLGYALGFTVTFTTVEVGARLGLAPS